MTEPRFQFNQAVATGRVMDGEAVLINVATGRYYSLVDASCVAWLVVSTGGSAMEAATAVAERYDVDADAVRTDVAALVEALAAEDLIAEADGSQTPDLPPAPPDREPYERLQLDTFHDMEELLAFDPPLPRAPDLHR